MRLIAYVRTSTLNGAGQDSLDAQADACREWAEAHGHEVVAVERDEAMSGSLGIEQRPGLLRALMGVEDGTAEGIIVHRIDRLARELHVQEAALARAWSAGAHVEVIEAVDGPIKRDDPNDPMRTFVRQVMGASAQLERGLVSARLQGGRRRGSFRVRARAHEAALDGRGTLGLAHGGHISWAVAPDRWRGCGADLICTHHGSGGYGRRASLPRDSREDYPLASLTVLGSLAENRLPASADRLAHGGCPAVAERGSALRPTGVLRGAGGWATSKGQVPSDTGGKLSAPSPPNGREEADMSQDQLDPLKLAEDESRQFLRRQLDRLSDLSARYVTVALLKVLGPSIAAAVLAVIALPETAAVVVVVALTLLVVYSVNATRLLKRKDAELRHAWIANKRLQQHQMEHEIATDAVILELMGERTQRPAPFRWVPPELRSAVAYLTHRLHQAESNVEALEAVIAGRATDAHRRTAKRVERRRIAPPKGPAVEPVRKRKEAREAERAALEAEIQSLALPLDVERAMQAEQANRTARERRDAAVKADQAARERARRGLRPTAEEGEQTLVVGVTPNGANDVRTGRRRLTPEQIARGESEDDEA